MTRNNTPRLVPALRYRDLAAAIEWLCIAFGFQKHRVIAGEDGALAVAQLSVGGNMIMLLPVGGSELDQLMMQPDEIGGAETQSCYLAVDDIDAHYAMAKAAGAHFVLDLKAYDNGGRGFSCRDPEGHIWNFGTYDPWDAKGVAASPPPVDEPAAPRGKRNAIGLMVAMAVVTVVVGMGGWTLATLQQAAPAAREARFAVTEETRLSAAEEARLKAEVAAARTRAQEALDRVTRITAELEKERSGRQAAERVAKEAREEFQRRQGAAQTGDEATRQLAAQLAEERRAKEAAERAVKTSADRVAKERSAKRIAQKATLVVQKHLALARAARRSAEQSAKEAAEALARERAARETAERAAKEALAKLNRTRTEKGGALPASPDRSSRLSKKSTQPVD